MESELPVWLTWENVIIVIAALEAFLGAIPNDWFKYKSYILKFFKFLYDL